MPRYTVRMETPTNIVTRLIEARFIVGVQDNQDPDGEPNWIAAEGEFTFKPDAKVVINRELGIVQLQTPLKGKLDDEGFLCLIDSSGAIVQRGIPLWVTDNPAMSAIGWTWSGTAKLRDANGVPLSDYVPAFTFELPMSEESLDLATVLELPPVPVSPGIPTGGGGVGPAGPPGKSAYQLALDAGFSGSLTQWLASLKGAKGDKGDKGAKGDPGIDGIDGIDGTDGTDGTQFTISATEPPNPQVGDVWFQVQ